MAAALAYARPGRDALGELAQRQPLLAAFALACFAGAALTGFAIAADPRTIGLVSVWLKPFKFCLSIGVFAATAAWFHGYVAPRARHGPLLRWTAALLVLAGGFELVWITWAGAHGRGSHFNISSPLYARMYQLMGLFAILLVGTVLPLAYAVARWPRPGLHAAFRLAVVLGLLITFALGGSLGGYISAANSAAVGAYASTMPLFRWNMAGGDLRIAHFLGIHAQQAVPLLGALSLSAGLPRPRLAVLAGSAAYALLTIALWRQAVAGASLF